jgi:hypothetical protein
MGPEKLLDAVKLTGEGKGRLSFGKSQNQFVFSVDSVLNDNNDWILAVSVPLHGEEVMILPNLKKEEVEDDSTDSFETRIQNEFQKLELSNHLSVVEFLKELRSLIRFQLAVQLGLDRNCKVHQREGVCTLGGEEYEIAILEKELKISKTFTDKHSLQLLAQNLTKSFFTKINIGLYEKTVDLQKNNLALSLELFW